MSISVPPLSIGLPVRNGARYLAGALDCLLGQTYSDFDLLVADNSSTDGTADIAQEYARRDSRVSYVRHTEDLGATGNFNYVFDNTRAPLFKWAAADDLHDPTFLQRCMEVHAADPDVVTVCSAIEYIDEEGRSLRTERDFASAGSPDPVARFNDFVGYDYSCSVNFGVHRREAIADTRKFLPFWGSDRVFLAELALRGRIVVIPEPLFKEREHGDRVTSRVAGRDVRRFQRSGKGSKFLTWRHASELVRAVRAADLDPEQRRRAYGVLSHWAVRERRKFARSLARGVVESVRR
ncbi:glycosyl transferase [Planotetraspora silvatica]|uniref:Glycosyl transferase n=1 Tax=Planotetraspora silvatica TaxID=234614 RepID=A0A8J3UL05_9ACTN|nr:glycosyltransferase [Planotetraspora silvatica]GII45687.1 glycosyl transferase [Planotetraspora silvatica]